MIIGEDKPIPALQVGESVKLAYIEQSRDVLGTAQSTGRRSATGSNSSSSARKRQQRAYVSRSGSPAQIVASVGTSGGSATAFISLACSRAAQRIAARRADHDLDVTRSARSKEALENFAGARWSSARPLFPRRVATHISPSRATARWSSSTATTLNTRPTATSPGTDADGRSVLSEADKNLLSDPAL